MTTTVKTENVTKVYRQGKLQVNALTGERQVPADPNLFFAILRLGFSGFGLILPVFGFRP